MGVTILNIRVEPNLGQHCGHPFPTRPCPKAWRMDPEARLNDLVYRETRWQAAVRVLKHNLHLVP